MTEIWLNVSKISDENLMRDYLSFFLSHGDSLSEQDSEYALSCPVCAVNANTFAVPFVVAFALLLEQRD